MADWRNGCIGGTGKAGTGGGPQKKKMELHGLLHPHIGKAVLHGWSSQGCRIPSCHAGCSRARRATRRSWPRCAWAGPGSTAVPPPPAAGSWPVWFVAPVHVAGHMLNLGCKRLEIQVPPILPVSQSQMINRHQQSAPHLPAVHHVVLGRPHQVVVQSVDEAAPAAQGASASSSRMSTLYIM